MTIHNHCNLCGKEITVLSRWNDINHRCDECREKTYQGHIINIFGNKRFCIFCGKGIIGPAKYCCNPRRLKKVSQYLIKKYPGKIEIISECSCENDKKYLHHPAHTDPFIVMKLCRTCHYYEHNPQMRKNGKNETKQKKIKN